MLSKKLHELRLERGLSCIELARLSGHPVSSIHNIETGVNKNPGFKIVCDIAEALKVDLEKLKEGL